MTDLEYYHNREDQYFIPKEGFIRGGFVIFDPNLEELKYDGGVVKQNPYAKNSVEYAIGPQRNLDDLLYRRTVESLKEMLRGIADSEKEKESEYLRHMLKDKFINRDDLTDTMKELLEFVEGGNEATVGTFSAVMTLISSTVSDLKALEKAAESGKEFLKNNPETIFRKVGMLMNEKVYQRKLDDFFFEALQDVVLHRRQGGRKTYKVLGDELKNSVTDDFDIDIGLVFEKYLDLILEDLDGDTRQKMKETTSRYKDEFIRQVSNYEFFRGLIREKEVDGKIITALSERDLDEVADRIKNSTLIKRKANRQAEQGVEEKVSNTVAGIFRYAYLPLLQGKEAEVRAQAVGMGLKALGIIYDQGKAQTKKTDVSVLSTTGASIESPIHLLTEKILEAAKEGQVAVSAEIRRIIAENRAAFEGVHTYLSNISAKSYKSVRSAPGFIIHGDGSIKSVTELAKKTAGSISKFATQDLDVDALAFAVNNTVKGAFLHNKKDDVIKGLVSVLIGFLFDDYLEMVKDAFSSRSDSLTNVHFFFINNHYMSLSDILYLAINSMTSTKSPAGSIIRYRLDGKEATSTIQSYARLYAAEKEAELKGTEFPAGTKEDYRTRWENVRKETEKSSLNLMINKNAIIQLSQTLAVLFGFDVSASL